MTAKPQVHGIDQDVIEAAIRRGRRLRNKAFWELAQRAASRLATAARSARERAMPRTAGATR